MKKLALVGLRSYCGDDIPDGGSSPDPDLRLTAMKELKDRLREKGIQLVHRSDITPDDAWGYLFVNYDEDEKFLKKLLLRGYKGKLFLLVFECRVIYPKNWRLQNHSPFDAVFTWDARPLPQSKKPLYFRYFIPNDLSVRTEPLPFCERKKLCVMMASNKWKRRPQELYSERFKAIRYFMEKHPEDFDLYGPDWSYGPFKKKLEQLRNLFRSLKGKPTRPVDVSPVYRGAALIKREVLKHYRFCICFENARDIPGYITEKIFDCFLAGTVPVYLGWEGVSDFIPQEAFIDFRSFGDYEKLYRHLFSMDPEAFASCVDAGARFISGDGAKPFTAQAFAAVLSGGISKFLPQERHDMGGHGCPNP